MKKTVFIAGALILLGALPALASSPVNDIEILRQEARAKFGSTPNSRWLEIDSNGDGKIDHRMLLSRNGDKIYEEMDVNHDGLMDDLCYYSRGVLARQEIDSNYDGKIDIWIFMKDGIYVERYMRDTNHDGVIDVIKEYGPGKK